MIPQAIDAANLSFLNEAAREEKQVTRVPSAAVGSTRRAPRAVDQVASRGGIFLYPCDEKNRHAQAP